MRKLVAVVFIVACLIYMAACGGSSSTTSHVTKYDLPAQPVAAVPFLMGGSIQKTQLSLTTPGTATLFAGSSGGFNNISSAGSGTFYRPIALTTDGTNLYVADYFNNAIRQINLVTKRVTTIAGNALGLAGSVDGTGTAASFYRPSGITTDKTNLYVTDSFNYTIRQIVIKTGEVTTVAGGVGLTGSVDAEGTNARFNILNGITTDGTSLYVTDSNNTIRRILIPSATVKAAVTTLAGAPGTSGSVDGVQGAARFNQPARVTTDGPNLYVTDLANRTIRKIALVDGTVTTIAGKVVAGSPGSNDNSTDGTGLTARFKQPNGITCDGRNLYVTDSYDNMIRQIVLSDTTVASGRVSTLTSIGTAELNSTIGITTDGTSLYLTNFTTKEPLLSHTIQVIN